MRPAARVVGGAAVPAVSPRCWGPPLRCLGASSRPSTAPPPLLRGSARAAGDGRSCGGRARAVAVAAQPRGVEGREEEFAESRRGSRRTGGRRHTVTEEAAVTRAALAELVAADVEQGEAAVSVRWLLQAAKREGAAWRATLAESVARRARREPVQYIVGNWPFHRLPRELRLRSPVLIPRPETEELVDIICRAYATGPEPQTPRRLVDLGSGSGAICVALLHAFPWAEGVAVEPSPLAAALTVENAARCGVAGRLQVETCSALDWSARARPGTFDLVVSNPPYVPAGELPDLEPEVRCFEDAAALDGGTDGLDVVHDVLRSAAWVGAPGARIFLEVHHTHPELFERAAAEASTGDAVGGSDKGNLPLELSGGMRLVRTSKDFFEMPRFVELRVAENVSHQS